MLLINLILYFLSFFIIWKISGFLVKTIGGLAKLLQISSFTFSFFVLGMLTSLPEIAVGLNAIADNNPQIFVGNLIGGIIVIFLLIIPLFAVIGNGVNLNHQLTNKNLFLILTVALTPIFLAGDQQLNFYEGILLIILCLGVFYFLDKRQSLIEKIENKFQSQKTALLQNIFLVIVGIGVIFLLSHFLVEQTIYFANYLRISSFVISLIILALGTNLPELSIGLYSLFRGQKEIAFGDYLGSAIANCLILGCLTIFNRAEIVIENHILQRLLFTVLGLTMFYFFAQSKNNLSRFEGILLLFIYFLFIGFEIIVR
jgi:cation:H+ antiporter